MKEGIPVKPGMTYRLFYRVRSAEEIVRRLAAEPPPVHSGCCGTCEFCGASMILDDPTQHEPDCPWRMAKEWVARD